MPRPLSRNKRIIYFTIFVLFFIVAIPVLLLYSSGYSLDTAFNLSWRGGIYVYVPQTGARVYIGNDLVGTTSLFSREVLVKNLTPSSYLVLVSNDDYWPWAKFVDVKRGEVSARHPLLVPKIIPLVEIPRASTTPYLVAKTLFASSTATTSLASKNIKVWVEGKDIHAEWLGSLEARPYYFCPDDRSGACPADIVIYQSTTPIRALDFYPGRDDALLLTTGNSVFATEIDPMMYRNSYPIFRGTQPEVRLTRDAVYIKDGAYIASTEL